MGVSPPLYNTRKLIRRGFAHSIYIYIYYRNLRILINARDLWPGKWDFLSLLSSRNSISSVYRHKCSAVEKNTSSTIANTAKWKLY